eukprot:4749106-Karenia_brevis.AAC.1
MPEFSNTSSWVAPTDSFAASPGRRHSIFFEWQRDSSARDELHSSPRCRQSGCPSDGGIMSVLIDDISGVLGKTASRQWSCRVPFHPDVHR